MIVTQAYELVNLATQETLGAEAVLNEDLSNIVDIGSQIFNANSVDKFAKSLVDHIGKVVFVDRPYSGSAPSVLMDGWEYGAVCEKVFQRRLPEAEENESWELEDRVSYDPNIFYKPDVGAKFFDKRVTFEIPQSITEMQIKSAFSSAQQITSFTSMLLTGVDNSMTVKTDDLVMRTINNMTAETIYDYLSTGAQITDVGNTRCVNLLKLYNDTYNQSLTADECIYNAGFIRFASYQMGVVKSRLAKISQLFNMGSADRFTPADRLHFVTLADFTASADVFLQSDTFHNEFVRLPKSETVPYWQGSGIAYDFDSISSINVKTASGHTVTASGILGVMFDRDALGVSNLDRKTTSSYNPKSEFYNTWFKFTSGYFNDFNENFVVFYVA
ncbi:MAG: hypothetical protein J6Y60_05385 [Treponema sp.]|nr:hypothetical protein [Treponema sp.]